MTLCNDQSVLREKLQRQASRDSGFSLVEVLVAMVLGLILIGGSIAIFQGNLRTARLGQTIASMQSNARFALDEIAGDLRAAGFRGCASTSAPMVVSTTVAPVDNATPAASSLVGATVATGGLTAVGMLGYVPPTDRGAPVVGTDALLIQRAQGPGETLQSSMTSESDSLDVAGEQALLEVGDLALIADCSGSELFRIGTRGVGTMKVSLQPDMTLARAYSVDPYGFGVHVYPFTSALYYIGDTGRQTRDGDTIRGLFVQSWPYTPDTNPPLELAESVDQLRLSFGIRNDTTESVRFVRADDSAFDATRVTSVRVGVLMSSNETFDENNAPREFSLAGQAVVAEGGSGANAAFYPDDDRLRMPFERSVAVRNRGLGERVE